MQEPFGGVCSITSLLVESVVVFASRAGVTGKTPGPIGDGGAVVDAVDAKLKPNLHDAPAGPGAAAELAKDLDIFTGSTA
mmetsp:Transcript_41957/g.98440  ORF Transcript_41957/g.98440 Transcript_41957/m.98440 type:complete len:80 (+) Transcript_41957:1653-1892(+)